MNLSKGIGPDSFYGKFLENSKVRHNTIKQLLSFLNKGSFPKYMSTGRLVLLSKTDSNFPKVSDTRPLVMESFLTKIAEKAMMKKL